MNSDRSARSLLLLAVGGLGAAAVMTQLALLRELLGAFAGNELVLGLGLGNWLLLTGAGTWLGQAAERRVCRRAHTVSGADSARSALATTFAIGLIAVALLPLAQIIAVRALRDVVFLRGTAVGVTGTLLGSLALLLPFCLVSGALLSLSCGALARDGAEPSSVGRVYVADTVGSIAGGALFSFALVPWFDHFALLCFPALVNLLLAGLLAWRCRARLVAGGAALAAVGLIAFVIFFNGDALSTAWQYAGQRTVHRANSPYGRLVVTEDSGQLTFFENGVPVVTTPAIEQVEETVHYAMSQRPDARKVLLISGGIAGTAREVLRYSVGEVVYVELDPAIVAAGRRLLPGTLADARIKVVTADGRRFVQQTTERFDVVIVAVPDPSTSQLNRFYTAEFFATGKRALAPGGVLAVGLSHYENYVSPELARLLASAHRTLQGSFAHVAMIPGGRVFFLASDGPLSLDIAARLERRGLATQFVNRHYLDATLAPDRLADLDRAVAQPAALNTDFNPALYFYELRHWLSQFTLPGIGFVVAAAAALAIYLARLRAVPRVIFASGFAASALEVVLLLGYQALYGSLYRQVGIIVTTFMAGLATGAWGANRKLRFPGLGTSRSTLVRLSLLTLAIAILAALLPVVLPRLGFALGGQRLVLLLTFSLAALVGAQFPLAAATDSGDAATAAARLYTADLVGAALGALLVSAWLIPLCGVTAVCLLTAGLNLVAAVLVWRPQPRT